MKFQVAGVLCGVLILGCIASGHAAERNLLRNPGFEDGLEHWTPMHEGETHGIYPSGTNGVEAHGGRQMFGSVCGHNETKMVRISQLVEGVTPGYRYRFAGYINTLVQGPPVPDKPVSWHMAKSRLIFCPRGEDKDEIAGTETDREFLVYSHPLLTFPHKWAFDYCATSKGKWMPLEIEARAERPAVRVLCHSNQLAPYSRNLLDDVSLTVVPIPTGSVTGKVSDPSGKEASGIIVELDPWGYRTETGDDGSFQLAGVPENDYILRCWRPGIGFTKGGIRVLADRATEVTCRLGESPDSLINGGFEILKPLDEKEALGWTEYGNGFDEVPLSEGWFFGYSPVEGKRTLGVAANWDLKNGGAYQKVSVSPGAEYQLQAWVLTHDEDEKGRMRVRIGIDPSGGNDPGTSDIIWSATWAGPREWHEMNVEAQAKAETITVFLDFTMTEMERFKVALFDQVRLTQSDRQSAENSTVGTVECVPAKGNLLINGGFESGDLVGWQRLYACPAPYEQLPTGPRDLNFNHSRENLAGKSHLRDWKYVYAVHQAWEGYQPRTGRFMFGGIHAYDSGGSRDFLSQRVPVEVGKTYRFSAYALTDTRDGDEKHNWVSLAVDPFGDFGFPLRSARLHGPWKQREITFVAQSEWVNVGVEMAQEMGYPWNVTFCDDLRLDSAEEEATKVRRVTPPHQQLTSRHRTPNENEITVRLPDGKTDIVLVRIPAGEFEMGGRYETRLARENELPRHKVRLPEYYIGKYEVTNDQYRAFCEATGRSLPADPIFGWKLHGTYRPYYYMEEHTNFPVLNVTWEDARAFCEWAGLRLPTEAEWEKAARGPRNYIYTNGDRWANVTNTMNNHLPADTARFTSRAGRFGNQPGRDNNPWGIRDMSGNVREWVFDWYGPYLTDTLSDPTGPPTGTHKVLRGGCWNTYEYRTETRFGFRMGWPPKFTPARETGFRVAADVKR
jgi:formylglycine-generating enzyme required for sulfatase activity